MSPASRLPKEISGRKKAQAAASSPRTFQPHFSADPERTGQKIPVLRVEEFFSDQQSFHVQFSHQIHERIHSHDFYELVFVLSGTAIHRFEETEEPISPGRILLIRPGRRHMYKKLCDLMLCNVLIKPEALSWFEEYTSAFPTLRKLFFSETYCCEVISTSQLAQINILLERLCMEQTGHPEGYLFAGKVFFMEMILLLCRSCNSGVFANSDKSLRLGQMLRFINLHYAEPITRQDIIRAGCCSIRTGNRIFAELLHSTPMQELLKVRISHALELLPFFPVSEVAIRCGFSDSNYFSLCFKKATGLSPRNYRIKAEAQI